MTVLGLGPDQYFGEDRQKDYGKGIAGGVRIPSHEAGKGGGSCGFDPHKPPPYQVIDMSGDSMDVVGTVDPMADVAVAEAEVVPPTPDVEELSPEGALSAPSPDVHAASVAPPPPPPPSASKPMKKVTFLGFGEFTVPYNDVFLDGMCLVLVYDRGNEVTFDPPIDADNAISLRYAGNVMKVYSSGIRFVEPGTNRVFTVLLIDRS